MCKREKQGVNVDFIYINKTRCSPGYSRHGGSVLIYEMTACFEDPAVVQGHEGIACSCGIVFPILTVRILQRRKLILSQHLVHHKPPNTHTHTHVRKYTSKYTKSHFQKNVKDGREWYGRNIATALTSSARKYFLMLLCVKVRHY